MSAPATTQNPPSPASPPPAPPITKRYYYKELYSNAWYIEGKPVPFEQLDGNRGILELDLTDPLVAGLDQAAKDQVGGIVRITEQEYHSKKNRFPFKGNRPQELLEVAPRADRPMGKAFRPPPPKESSESPAQLADGKTPDPAPLSQTSGTETPQRPPDQPDFTSEGKAAKFTPKTARAGVDKATPAAV